MKKKKGQRRRGLNFSRNRKRKSDLKKSDLNKKLFVSENRRKNLTRAFYKFKYGISAKIHRLFYIFIKSRDDISRDKNKKKQIYNVIIGVCTIAFVVSAFELINLYREYEKGKKVYSDLIQDAIIQPVPTKDVAPASGDKQTQKAKATKTPGVFQVDFDFLHRVNKDVVGWIYSPGTVINYPIVHGDDNQYYLKHLINGMYNSSGTPFMDVQNHSDFSDDNSVIYGHHMKNGTMFAGIVKYQSQKYFNTHAYLLLDTPTQKYRIILFSGYITKKGSRSYVIRFSDDRKFQQFITSAKEKSDFKSNVDVGVNDKIITLSTCTYEYKNARYVLHGKLVPVDSFERPK